MLQILEHSEISSRIKISVAAIIPLYNGAAFIRESLESVLAQSEPADEIIVVDDGSTDGGAEIVKEMATHHPIRLISKTNGGIGSARNRGIAEAKSTHIALLDQDDVWYEDHLAVLKRPFLSGEHRNLGLVYANLDRIDRDGRMVRRNFLDEVPSPHPKTSLLQCLSQDMFILPGASLFTKEVFEQVGRFDERLSGYEDDDLFLRVFVAGFESIYLRDKAVTKWRIYTGSTSFSPRMAKSRMIYFDKLVKAHPDDPILNLHWVRDLISPRFFVTVRNDFIDGMKHQNLPRMEQAWSDIQEILPVMRKGVRRRMKLVAPLISLLYRSPFKKVTRGLLSFASGRQFKMKTKQR